MKDQFISVSTSFNQVFRKSLKNSCRRAPGRAGVAGVGDFSRHRFPNAPYLHRSQ
jgi:hypothetical protein